MPALPLKVENLRYQTAKPTTSPFHAAKSQNTRGLAPNSAASIIASVATHSCGELFVFGKLAHELKGESGLTGTRGADGETHAAGRSTYAVSM